MNSLCRPQIIHLLGPAASLFLDHSQVAYAEIWWCPTPISGVCQTSPFCRQGREAALGRKTERENIVLAWNSFWPFSGVLCAQCCLCRAMYVGPCWQICCSWVLQIVVRLLNQYVVLLFKSFFNMPATHVKGSCIMVNVNISCKLIINPSHSVLVG